MFFALLWPAAKYCPNACVAINNELLMHPNILGSMCSLSFRFPGVTWLRYPMYPMEPGGTILLLHPKLNSLIAHARLTFIAMVAMLGKKRGRGGGKHAEHDENRYYFRVSGEKAFGRYRIVSFFVNQRCFICISCLLLTMNPDV